MTATFILKSQIEFNGFYFKKYYLLQAEPF